MNSDFRMVELMNEVYKKTLAYELEKVKINEYGSTTHIHSDKFLDEQPERRESPEFTEKEEKEQAKFLFSRLSKAFDKFGSFFGNW